MVSDVGMARDHNEDRAGLAEPPYGDPRGALYVVADGVGGNQAGEVAASQAVDRVLEAYYRLASAEPDGPAGPHGPDGVEAAGADDEPGPAPLDRWERALRQAIREANRNIARTGRQRASERGMSTTLVCALVVGDELIVAHLGDSRAYLVRDRAARLLTRDHNWANELMDTGSLTADQARAHPNRNVLTRYLGSDVDLPIDVQRERLRPGDTVLLCSDGLYGVVSDAELAVAGTDPSLENAAEHLIGLALQRGAPDNVTLCLVRAHPAGQAGLYPPRGKVLIDAEVPDFGGNELSEAETLRRVRVLRQQRRQSQQVTPRPLPPRTVVLAALAGAVALGILVLVVSGAAGRLTAPRGGPSALLPPAAPTAGALAPLPASKAPAETPAAAAPGPTEVATPAPTTAPTATPTATPTAVPTLAVTSSKLVGEALTVKVSGGHGVLLLARQGPRPNATPGSADAKEQVEIVEMADLDAGKQWRLDFTFPLTPNNTAPAPVFAPASGQLAYVDGQAPAQFVTKLALTGNAEPQRLEGDRGTYSDLAWNPAGDRLAASFHANGGPTAVVVATAPGATKLAPVRPTGVPAGNQVSPQWTADNNLVFQVGTGTIVLEAGGKVAWTLAGVSPAVSADGKRLGYVQGGGAAARLAIVDLQGTTRPNPTPAQLTPAPSANLFALAPDGSSAIFQQGQGSDRHFVLVKPGGATTPIDLPAGVSWLSWSTAH